MINVFITGARGYIKMYAGWTALVHGLCENQQNTDIQYWIYEVTDCKDEDNQIVDFQNVKIIKRYVDGNGGMAMIKYDYHNAKHAIKFIKENRIENPIILFLGLRIGPLAYLMRHKMKKAGAVIMENAAGVEWKRPKWGKIAQIYMRLSAYFMARACDYLICDAEAIKDIYDKMIKSKRPHKLFIPYGSYPAIEIQDEYPQKVKEYFEKYRIVPNEYYVIVNRFVPENSYELILSQFVESKTKKDLILVTNNDKEHDYYNELASKIPFEKDSRIKFVGTMYDKDILNYLRQCAFGYINGHTLGGTNPGLLEAMASTGFVLAHNNVFSHEVCNDLAIYYDKDHPLCDAIEKAESLTNQERERTKIESRKRMSNKYDWKDVAASYEQLFEKATKEKK